MLVYFLLGDLQEALVLMGFVLVVMGITFYQERKTERALDALRDLSSPRALVIRDGEEKRIAGREVVPGDLIVLAEGDRVPADARPAQLHEPIRRRIAAHGRVCLGAKGMRRELWTKSSVMARPGGDDLPFVYSGSLVVQGQGVALARATGINTEIGKIGKALQKVDTEKTALQEETNRWSADWPCSAWVSACWW